MKIITIIARYLLGLMFTVFGFLGVTDATFLTAGGTAALNQGRDRDAFLAPHLQVVQSHAQAI